MRRYILLITCLLLNACASIVNVDYDKATNFANLKTFMVESKPVRVAQDTRIDSPFMQQRVATAIQQALKAKGMKSVISKADLQVKYYLDIKQEIESTDSGMTIGVGTSSGSTAFGFGFAVPASDTSSYDKLVVTLDMVSGSNGKLIWRGSLAYRLHDGGTPEKRTEQIQKMVQEILKQFPPH